MLVIKAASWFAHSLQTGDSGLVLDIFERHADNNPPRFVFCFFDISNEALLFQNISDFQVYISILGGTGLFPSAARVSDNSDENRLWNQP